MRRTLVLLVAIVLAAGACSETGRGRSFREVAGGRPPEGSVTLRLASSLKPFDACGEFLDHVRAEAAARTGPYGIAGGGMVHAVAERAMALGGTSAPPSPSAPTAVSDAAAGDKAEQAPAISGTNVQEAGVDEADVVKTDGRRIFAVAQGRLQVFAVEDGRHRLAGSVLLPGGGPHDLLLAGDRVLVRSSSWSATPLSEGPVAGMVAPGPGVRGVPAGVERTVFSLVDVSDAAHPAVASTFEVDGRVIGARMVGDVARVVTASGPQGFSPVHPMSGTPEDEARATEANQAQVQSSTLRNWLPTYRAEGQSGILVDCERVSHPAEFSGLGTISVLTFDLSEGLGDGDAVTVLADGETVYASAEALYVATTRYPDVAPLVDRAAVETPVPVEQATEIHKFDITGDGPARHVASGRVRGHVLNQFSMSEHEGRLRVATTENATDGSESYVTVLEERAGALTTVGEVGGLGRSERIYAVRFLGDVGYVVTFRQTDPLYTLDLSDPAAPRVVGELKIPGYSAYLHPVGEDLLLGVGQDATEEGRRTGAQVSLFDISDPAHPRRLDQVALGSGQVAAEFDHHAFLWWAPQRLAVLPLQVWEPTPRSGAVGIRVEPGRGLSEVGRVTHRSLEAPEPQPGRAPSPVHPGGGPIERSLVVGDTLFTFSQGGVLASSLDDLEPLSWVSY